MISTPDLRPSLMSILGGLMESDLLDQVVTTFGIHPDTLTRMRRWPVLGARLSRVLGKRVYPVEIAPRLSLYRSREICRLLSARTPFRRLTHRIWHWAELGFDAHVARVHAGQSAWLYGMEHSSLDSFRAQKAQGGHTVLRMVNAHGNVLARILAEESERFPHWTNEYYRRLMTDQQQTLERKHREYDCADHIIANSAYVRKTLIEHGIASDRIEAIPTGCPPVANEVPDQRSASDPCRFLFVGSVSLRKGVPYLLEAWKRLSAQSNAVLTMIGSNEMNLSAADCRRYRIDYRGVVDSGTVRQLFRSSDVFILPTLAEGLAHSALEALSQGLPIIATEESGLGDFLTPGCNGWRVPARDAEALATACDEALNQTKQLRAMGEESRVRASKWTVDDSNQAHLNHLISMMNRTHHHG